PGRPDARRGYRRPPPAGPDRRCALQWTVPPAPAGRVDRLIAGREPGRVRPQRADDSSLTQADQEIPRAVEVRHFDVGGADTGGVVGVGSGRTGQLVPAGEVGGALVDVGRTRLRVEDLDRVHAARRAELVGDGPDAGACGVVRVRQADQAALRVD